MANVLLTTRCNLKCPYCFAQEKLGEGQKLVMSMSDVKKVIDFLNRSNHPMFRAMGGEPTLHPQFLQILEMALENGMRMDLLSNATWPESYNSVFERISPRRIIFLLNIDHPERYAPQIWQRIERNLKAVAGHGNVTLSFNIFEKKPRYEYILDLARTYRIDKVRMSFSLPVVGANNACLKLEEYKEMAPFVVEFARQAEETGVQVRMDNAVPLCMFNYEQAGELLLKGVVDFQRNMRCEPVIDIGPDLSVWCCFCLSKMWNRHLDEFENLGQVHDYYRQALSLYQSQLYPLDECETCRYRELWNCQGGCITHSVLKHGELKLEEPRPEKSEDRWNPDAVLALCSSVEVRRYDMPKPSYVMFNKRNGMELEVDGSFQPLLDRLKAQCTAQEAVSLYLETGTDHPKIDSELGAWTQGALREGANELLLRLLDHGLVEQR